MAYDLRPLSFGEILDVGFRVIRDHVLLFTSICLPVYLVQAIPSLLVGTDYMIPAQILAGFGMIVLAPLMQAALYSAVADAYLGRPTSAAKAYRRVLSIFLPYFGTSLLMGLLIIFGLLLLIVPGIYLAIAWVVVGAVMIVEGRFGMRALERSRDLMRGHWWRGFGVTLVAGLMMGAVGGGLVVLFAFIPIVGPLLTAVIQSVLAAYGSIVMIVLYFDLRCRLEDFDLQYLAQQLGSRPASSGQDPVG